MAVTHVPLASEALYDTFIGVTFDDPDTFAAVDPVRVDSKYFLKPIQDEVLNLIALSLSSGAALRVRNQTGSTITKGRQVYISGTLNVDEAGDASAQLASWQIEGATIFNTRAGKLYWKLTNSGTTRTVDLYRDSGGATATRVATGARVGDGVIALTAVNSSGITGGVTVTYTIDDTDLTANILELNRLLITLADADTPETAAQLVMAADLATATNGTAYAEREVTGIDTSIVTTVGDPLYLSATAGDFTQTAPTGADTIKQRVGHVLVKHATLGSALFYPGRRVVEKWGTSSFMANSVTDAKFRQSAAVSVVGRSANSTGDVADIAAGANDTMLVRQANALAFITWASVMFSDAEGDPTTVSLTAAADGTSAFAARRDHRHLLDVAIAPTWSGVHIFNASRFFLNNPANTFKVGFEMGAEVADRTLTFPLMGGARTVPYLERANTWSAAQDIVTGSATLFPLSVSGGDQNSGIGAPQVPRLLLGFDVADNLGYINSVDWSAAWKNLYIQFQECAMFAKGSSNFWYFGNNGNLLGGTVSPGTSAVYNIGLASGTAPTTSPADYAAMWVADVGGAAGNAGPHWRVEAHALPFAFGGLVGAVTYPAFYFGVTTPSATNYTIVSNGTQTNWNSNGAGYFLLDAATKFTIGASGLTIGGTGPVTGTNILKIESGTAWTSVAGAIGLRSLASAANKANFWAQNEAGILKALTGLDSYSTADTLSASATLANITGNGPGSILAVDVVAAGIYKIQGLLHLTIPTTLEGAKVSVGGTATRTNMAVDVEFITHEATPVLKAGRITAIDGTATTGAYASTGAITVYMDGTIEVLAAGTIKIQFAKDTHVAGNLTALRDCSLILTQIA